MYLAANISSITLGMSTFSAVKVQVPEGLEQVLYELSREVLRDQPANIYAYAAQYFQNKVAERKGLLCIDYLKSNIIG